MYRFPLFIGAKPIKDLASSKVLLGEGKWEITSTCTDSAIECTLDGLPIDSEQPFDVAKTSYVQCKFTAVGKEAHVDVWALLL